MVGTPRHGVPYDAAEESEESKDGERENGGVYDDRWCGGYRGVKESIKHIAGP